MIFNNLKTKIFRYLKLRFRDYFSPVLYYYFLKSIFFKKNIKYIDKDLILIGQIQRSGGTILSQLLDNHSELVNFPSELILTKPKWNWSKNLIFSTIKINDPLRTNIVNRNYEKLSKGKISNKTKNEFVFNPFIEKKIFKSLKTGDLRSKFNAYFTAFFNAFLNYDLSNIHNSKYIFAFLPRFIMFDKNINLFFRIYPNGKLVSIIRDPKSWLLSAKKHSNAYKNTLSALELWKKSCENSLKYKKKYSEKIILIKFDELINDTESTMRKVCLEANINFEANLLSPTFNGNNINSDSSFESSFGKVDKRVLLTKEKMHLLSNNDIKLLASYEDWYKYFITKI